MNFNETEASLSKASEVTPKPYNLRDVQVTPPLTDEDLEYFAITEKLKEAIRKNKLKKDIFAEKERRNRGPNNKNQNNEVPPNTTMDTNGNLIEQVKPNKFPPEYREIDLTYQEPIN